MFYLFIDYITVDEVKVIKANTDVNKTAQVSVVSGTM